ncbi:MAG: DNA methylase [Clostridia bacterium]|nr:DNA methylase [Clostridia bacterium]
MKERKYVAIDLKSFYASVECRDRGLDPLRTNLLVADLSRTEKTICLAVSPSLKSFGVPSRPRLFEAIAAVKEANAARREVAGRLKGSSTDLTELNETPSLAIDYITAKPRMARYIEYSTRIYKVYLNYAAPEDIHVYSIDEVFIDLTDYLTTYGKSARELTETILRDVLAATGITATAGIGTNLYLAKVAMDIVAKKLPADEHGARIAELDERSYRELLWDHRPLTDFWRVGRGYARSLEAMGLYTMGDVARCSLGRERDYYNEELLYRAFGVNAELLIDHAWGYESCTMADIKAYTPTTNSLGAGQVLHCPYDAKGARLITLEMADQLSLDLFSKGLMTDSLTVTLNYDSENLEGGEGKKYRGEVGRDFYGRAVPKHAHGTKKLGKFTSSTTELMQAAGALFDEIVNDSLLIRRIGVTFCHVISAKEAKAAAQVVQLDFFSEEPCESASAEREEKKQQAILDIKRKFGKNAIMRGLNLEEGATARDRNEQIGGHKA